MRMLCTIDATGQPGLRISFDCETGRRDPLDFSDSGSRVSTLLGFESLQERRRIVPST